MDAKPGKETTEYQITKAAKLVAYVGLALAVVIAFGPKMLGLVPADSMAAEWLAAIVAIATQVQKFLVELGYIKSRTELKK